MDYLRDPAEIYARSFATVRAEAATGQLPESIAGIVLRLVHACGMPDIVADLTWSEDAAVAGREALRAGAPVFTDCEMVRAGINTARLPAANAVLCTLNDPRVAGEAREGRTTRSAAAVDLWDERLSGAVVAIGNAPTALYRLLERIDAGAPRPAVVLAFPVGFVGAVELKEELAARPRGLPFMTLRGRRGGSALASAAVNALCAETGP